MTGDLKGYQEAIVEVWVNCPDEAIAATIADNIVRERLAACSNIYPSIVSRYRWRGAIETANEVPLLLKTRLSLFEVLAKRVADLHPYDTPSILGHEICHAPGCYRAWLIDQTRSVSKEDHEG